MTESCPEPAAAPAQASAFVRAKNDWLAYLSPYGEAVVGRVTKTSASLLERAPTPLQERVASYVKYWKPKVDNVAGYAMSRAEQVNKSVDGVLENAECTLAKARAAVDKQRADVGSRVTKSRSFVEQKIASGRAEVSKGADAVRTVVQQRVVAPVTQTVWKGADALYGAVNTRVVSPVALRAASSLRCARGLVNRATSTSKPVETEEEVCATIGKSDTDGEEEREVAMQRLVYEAVALRKTLALEAAAAKDRAVTSAREASWVVADAVISSVAIVDAYVEGALVRMPAAERLTNAYETIKAVRERVVRRGLELPILQWLSEHFAPTENEKDTPKTHAADFEYSMELDSGACADEACADVDAEGTKVLHAVRRESVDTCDYVSAEEEESPSLRTQNTLEKEISNETASSATENSTEETDEASEKAAAACATVHDAGVPAQPHSAKKGKRHGGRKGQPGAH